MTQKEQLEAYERIGNRFEGRMKTSFIEAVKTLDSRIDIKELEEAIASRFENRVIDSSHINELESLLFGFGVAGIALSQEMANAYLASATKAQNLFPKKISIALSFDITNPKVTEYLETYRPQQIKYITDESRKAIAQVLKDGYRQGIPPQKIARQIRDSIGLTPSQAQAVNNFRLQLEGRDNMGLTPVNRRRIDAIARRRSARQLKTGYMTQKEIDEMVEKYRKSMINRRALNIARTESFQAVGQGRLALWKQAQSQGLLPPETRKKPITAADERVRQTHTSAARMNAKGVPISQPYKTPFGDMMSAPYAGQVNCRCTDVLIGL